MSRVGTPVDAPPGEEPEARPGDLDADPPRAAGDGGPDGGPYTLTPVGSSARSTKMTVVEPPVPSDPARPILEIEDGETTLFEAAISAYHAGEFQRAESLFLEEAERTVDSAPQRAAIAFRQAALAAREGGNSDGSDHWMRLAGREYLKVSEDARTPLPYIREAALMAAKCFLSVENIHVASKGLRRAQAIDSVLRADDDLMADVPGIPFRHADPGQAAAAAVEPAVEPGPPAATTGVRRAPAPPVAAVTPADPPVATTVGPGDPRGGWLRRLLRRVPSSGTS